MTRAGREPAARGDARARVLAAVRAHAAPAVARPDLARFDRADARDPNAARAAEAAVDAFADAVRAAGGACVAVDGGGAEAALARALAAHAPLRDARRVVAAGVALAGVREERAVLAAALAPGARLEALARAAAPHAFADVDVAIVRGAFGVAENGAVALAERGRALRGALLLCQHLVLVVRADDLVADMHAAYARLAAIAPIEDLLDADVDAGAGVGGAGGACWRGFVAGPSKTADIEQALVTGAHGPRSLLVAVERATPLRAR